MNSLRVKYIWIVTSYSMGIVDIQKDIILFSTNIEIK